MVVYKLLKNLTVKSIQQTLRRRVKKSPLLFFAGVLVGTGVKEIFDECNIPSVKEIFDEYNIPSVKEIFDEYNIPSVAAGSENPSNPSSHGNSVANLFEKYGEPNHLATLHYSNHLLQVSSYRV